MALAPRFANKSKRTGARNCRAALVPQAFAPYLFLTISVALVGAYLAFSIPVAVFPNTDFPRVVVGSGQRGHAHRPDAGHHHPPD